MKPVSFTTGTGATATVAASQASRSAQLHNPFLPDDLPPAVVQPVEVGVQLRDNFDYFKGQAVDALVRVHRTKYTQKGGADDLGYENQVVHLGHRPGTQEYTGTLDTLLRGYEGDSVA